MASRLVWQFEFTLKNPGLDIDLAADLRSIRLDRHQADIAVRVGHPLDGDLIAKQVGSMAFGFDATANRWRARRPIRSIQLRIMCVMSNLKRR